jgi:hypothetical protein
LALSRIRTFVFASVIIIIGHKTIETFIVTKVSVLFFKPPVTKRLRKQVFVYKQFKCGQV